MKKFDWKPIKEYEDILFDYYDGIAKITINRPQVYNAFRPQTNNEMLDAMAICRERPISAWWYSPVPATRPSARVATRR